MKTKKALFLSFIILSFLYNLTGCSNVNKGTSRVTINLNLDRSIKSGAENSWTNKIGSLINPQPKGSAPSNLTSVTLTVSGKDMENIIKTFTTDIPASIEVEVPSGNGRTFVLSAISDTYYFTGSSTTNLAANVETTLDITMGIMYSAVTITATFSGGTGSNVTSYDVEILLGGTTFVPKQAFTPGVPIQVPAGPNRQFIVTAYSPTGNYSGSLMQTLTGDINLPVTLAMENANVVINFAQIPGNPTITSYKVTVTLAGGTVLVQTQDFVPGTAFLVPAGTGRIFNIMVYSAIGNFAYTTTMDLTVNTTAVIAADMTMLTTTVAINIYFPTLTPAVNMEGTFAVNVKSGAITINTQEFTPGTPFTIPSGDNLDIEVIANTASVYFKGTVPTQTINPNTSLTFDVNLALFETKLVIPDYMNNRIVQIDDITGANWIEKTYSDFAVPTQLVSYGFGPYTIDFDSLGRIYVGLMPSDYNICMIRFDNIDNTDYTLIGSCTFGAGAMAIDRKKDIIYYLDSSAAILYQINTDGTNEVQLNNPEYPSMPGYPTMNYITGMAVDDNGILYITCQDPNGFPIIVKYDPTIAGTPQGNVISLDTLYDASAAIYTATDVKYKAGYLYVAMIQDMGNQILKIDPNTLAVVGGFGAYYNNNPLPSPVGSLYGAKKFIGIRDKELVIIDEGFEDIASTIFVDRLISIDDINGTSWNTYGASGSGVGYFNFYQ